MLIKYFFIFIFLNIGHREINDHILITKTIKDLCINKLSNHALAFVSLARTIRSRLLNEGMFDFFLLFNSTFLVYFIYVKLFNQWTQKYLVGLGHLEAL